jgi:hypothetical protein
MHTTLISNLLLHDDKWMLVIVAINGRLARVPVGATSPLNTDSP